MASFTSTSKFCLCSLYIIFCAYIQGTGCAGIISVVFVVVCFLLLLLYTRSSEMLWCSVAHVGDSYNIQ